MNGMTKTAVAVLMFGISGPVLADDSGTVNVTLTVTAPQAPTVAISELQTLGLGTLDVSQLTANASSAPASYFCIAVNNPDNQPVAPKLKFSQPTVGFRPEIAANRFALLGPNRSDDGNPAQLPFEINYHNGTGSGSQVIVRDQQTTLVPNFASACGANFVAYSGGASKPSINAFRKAATPGNPAGEYRAIILIMVTPN